MRWSADPPRHGHRRALIVSHETHGTVRAGTPAASGACIAVAVLRYRLYEIDRMVAVFAARLKDAVDQDSVRDDLAGVVNQSLEPATSRCGSATAIGGGENHGPFGRKALEFCFLG